MPLRYLDIPEAEYIPKTIPLSEQMTMGTATNIDTQGREQLAAMNQMQLLGHESISSLQGLTASQRAEIEEKFNNMGTAFEDHVEQYGARNARNFVTSSARQFSRDLKPYQQRSNSYMRGIQSIDESNADPDLKNAARILFQHENQNTPLFGSNGEVQLLNSTRIEDVLKNPLNLAEISNQFVKDMKERGEEGLAQMDLSNIGNSVATMFRSMGVTKSEAELGAINNLLANPQARSQLEILLRSSSLSDETHWINQFKKEDGTIDFGEIKDITIQQRNGEPFELKGMNPLTLAATQQVMGAIHIAGVKETSKFVPSTITNALGGRQTETSQILSGISPLITTSSSEEGKNFREFKKEYTVERERLQAEEKRLNDELAAFEQREGLTESNYLDINPETGRIEIIDPVLARNNRQLANIVAQQNALNSQAREFKYQVESVYNSALDDLINGGLQDYDISLTSGDDKKPVFNNEEHARQYFIENMLNFEKFDISQLDLSEFESQVLIGKRTELEDLEDRFQQAYDFYETNVRNFRPSEGASSPPSMTIGRRRITPDQGYLDRLSTQIQLARESFEKIKEGEKNHAQEIQRFLNSDLDYLNIEGASGNLLFGTSSNTALIRIGDNVYYKADTGDAGSIRNTINSNATVQRANNQLLKDFHPALDIYANETTHSPHKEGFLFRLNRQDSRVENFLEDIERVGILNIEAGLHQFYTIDGEPVDQQKYFRFDERIAPRVEGIVYNGPNGEPALLVRVRKLDYGKNEGPDTTVFMTGNDVTQLMREALPNADAIVSVREDMLGKLGTARAVGTGEKQVTIPNKYLSQAGLLSRSDGSTVPFEGNVTLTHSRHRANGKTNHVFQINFDGLEKPITTSSFEEGFDMFLRELSNYEGNFNEQTYLDMLRPVESGGDDSAVNRAGSSALGRYQFIDGTWADLVRQDTTGTLTRDGRTNPEQQEVAIRIYNESSKNHLRNSKLPITNHNMYMLHLLGQSGGIEFLQLLQTNPNELAENVLSDRIIRLNRRIFEGKTIRQAYIEATKNFS